MLTGGGCCACCGPWAGGGEARGAIGDVGAQGFGGSIAERDVALLLALAANEDDFVGPLDVFEVEGGELGVADAAAVKQLEDGAVARGPGRGFVVDGVDHTVHLLDGRDARQVLGEARCRHERCGILFHAASASQPFEPASNGGQGAGGRCLGEAAIVERGEIGADVGVFDAVGCLRGAEGGDDVGGEVGEFAVVGAQGVGGGAAFVGEDAEVVGD